MADEKIESCSGFSPQIITVISIEDGTHDVVVQNLSVAHAAADMRGFFLGDCDGQSATNLRSGAVQVNCSAGKGGCQRITIENVGVSHTGGTGVVVAGVVTDATLSRLVVSDVGASGVRIGSKALDAYPLGFAHSSNSDRDVGFSSSVGAAAPLAGTITGVSLLDSEISTGGNVFVVPALSLCLFRLLLFTPCTPCTPCNISSPYFCHQHSAAVINNLKSLPQECNTHTTRTAEPTRKYFLHAPSLITRYLMGPGVSVDDCARCTVSHNDIHDFKYTGVSTGYGFANGLIVDSVLSYNHIHHVGNNTQEFGLSDLACVYTWGGSQTLLVDHNLCHDVTNYNYGGWGFYNDQTTTSVQWTNNVVHSTNASAYHNHEGVDVGLHNNVLVGDGSSNPCGVLRSAAPTPPPTSWYAKANITHNVLFARRPAMFEDTEAPKDWGLSTLDSNVYVTPPSFVNSD
jgi:hypothetical protein